MAGNGSTAKAPGLDNFHEQGCVIQKFHTNCSIDGAMLSRKQSLFYIRSSGEFHSGNFVEITMYKTYKELFYEAYY